MVRRVMRVYREAFSGLSGQVWALATVTFVNRSGSMVLPFLTLYLTQKKGFSPAEAGRILGLYGVGALGGAWTGGRLSDAVGPRRVMLLSLVCAGAGFPLLGTLDGRWAIGLMVVCLSLVGEAVRPATGAALAEAAPPRVRVKAFALNRLAANLGLTFGPAAGGFLALRDYHWLFIADGGTCLLAALLLRRSLRDGRGSQPHRRVGDRIADVRSPWRDGVFLGLLGLLTLLAMMLFQTFSTWPLTLRRIYGLTEERIGLLFAVNTLIIVLFEMVLVHRLASRHPLRVAGFGCFLFGAGLGLTPAGSGFGFVVLTVLIWTVGEMLSLPQIEGFVAGRAGEGGSGRYMGLFSIAFSVSFILAPVMGTWIYQRRGPSLLWAGCVVLGICLWAGMRTLSALAEAEARRNPERVGDA